jgi:hypothetical protein
MGDKGRVMRSRRAPHHDAEPVTAPIPVVRAEDDDPAEPQAKAPEADAEPAEAEPADAGGKPVEADAKLPEAEAKPVQTEVNAEPAEVNAEPAEVNAEPAEVNAEPAEVNAEPLEADTEPAKAEPVEADLPAEAKSVEADAKLLEAQATPVQTEVNAEPAMVNPEPAKAEPAKADVKPVGADAESVQTEAGPVGADTKPVKPVDAQADPTEAAGGGQPDPDAQSAVAADLATRASAVSSTEPDSVKPGPVKPGPAKPELAKPDLAKPELAKPGPVKPGPVKPAPAKTELAKPGSAAADSAVHPAGLRLAGAPGTADSRRGAADPHPVRRPEPSWGEVADNTLRLWLHRRTAGSRWLAILVVVVLVFAAGAVTVLITRRPAAAPRAGPAGQGTGGGGIAAASAARREAAAWVAAQVSRNAIVACDPVTCDTLQTAGFPAASLIQLEPSAGDPLGSAIVMATATLRSQIGSRLTSVYAPVVLASFGSGAARVDIRVTAPDGSAAYLKSLHSDLQARVAAGTALLGNTHMSFPPAARQQLTTGQVDTRLLITLASLTAQRDVRNVRVVAFSGSGPHASPGMPLRIAELASPQNSADGGRSYLNSVLAFAAAQRAPYLATNAGLERLSGGQLVVRIQFAAPSPLGLLNASSGSSKTNGRKS